MSDAETRGKLDLSGVSRARRFSVAPMIDWTDCLHI
jgi:hypothetical protein